jgi:hypothetical protein
MADTNKFEEMLERLIAEDKAGAEELFHEIVVEKSREIYADLLESEVEDEEVDEATEEDEEVDESTDDDDKEVDEGFDLDEFEVEADDDMMDPTDSMLGDVEVPGEDEMGDMDMDMGDDEGDTEERIDDLEDALEKLQQEFEELLSKDGGSDDDSDDMDMDMGDEDGGDEEAGDDMDMDDEETEESFSKSQTETMREYVEKVTAKMGDTGTNGTKSAVAGKNDMGGTAGNIAQSDTGDVAEAGAGGTVKGSSLSSQKAKEENMGNVNVPGGNASKSMKAQPKGHGAEKKGAGETADKGAGSTIKGK